MTDESYRDRTQVVAEALAAQASSGYSVAERSA
jgi:hypothetical protein